MDSRRNWILLDAVSQQTNAPIRISGTNFPATHSRDEQRFENMNRLNERIHRRLTEQTDANEGARVVDESFRFINDEPVDRMDQLIAQRDSRGEVEAIFERRREPGLARRTEPRMWPAIEELPEPPDDGDEDDNDDVYKNSPALYLEPSLRYHNHRFRRRDSSDSQTTRVIRPTDYHGGRMPLPSHDDRRPTTLRRTPLFYDKCDICAYKIFRTGDYCPACGRMASPVKHIPRSPRTNPSSYTEMLLSPPRLMFEPWAGRPYLGYQNSRPRQNYYNMNITRPRTMWTAKRRVQRPVYRYGSSLPEAMYDYEVWAKKKDSRLMRRKAAAIALALLALALVISAGVVLAAVKN